MLKILKQWIEGVNWLASGQHVPAWVEAGISHGFEGLGFQLPTTVYSLQQVHGIQLIEIKSSMDPQQQVNADGLWTKQPGLTLAVKTADCVSVLFYHPRLVMAIHAGWKGLAQDIIGAGLEVLAAQKIEAQECRVAIGPAISLDSFEVGPEVITHLRRGAYALSDEELAFASSKGVHDRWHLDLSLLAALRLQRAGWQAEQVSIIRTCTQKHPLLWHSFRRDGASAGRNWTWIKLQHSG